ncbi:MAG: Superfamily and helicase and helicase subunit-like [Gemmataceae bacterium]|nr:Superfamily and helicase and helicase subunit-like [Gemmataceae bacterium]
MIALHTSRCFCSGVPGRSRTPTTLWPATLSSATGRTSTSRSSGFTPSGRRSSGREIDATKAAKGSRFQPDLGRILRAAIPSCVSARFPDWRSAEQDAVRRQQLDLPGRGFLFYAEPRECYLRSRPAERAGVVVPQRAQRAALQQAFPELCVIAAGLPARAAVDTVERFRDGVRTVEMHSATDR